MALSNDANNLSQMAVLSYNICFQAMTNNATGSATNLGARCVFNQGSKLTTCGTNMAHMIEAIPGALGVVNFDFVGLQEASHWYDLPAVASNTLGNMSCFHSREGRSDMATYYDDTKYTLVKHFTGDFSTDRPWQILIFKNGFDSTGTIFINVHNPHGFSYDQIRSQFSKAVKGKLSEDEKGYRIIAVGDYNETSWNWKSRDMDSRKWMPFDKKIIPTPIKISKAVISCAEDGKWTDANMNDFGMRGGDYIFDSRGPALVQVPPNYDYNQYMSDHLPVVALLPR